MRRCAAGAPGESFAAAESAADAACALAAAGPSAAAALRDAGAVAALAALLSHASGDARVRALLCLSMLLADPSAARALLDMPDALARLRALAQPPAAGAAAGAGAGTGVDAARAAGEPEAEGDGDEGAIAADMLMHLASVPGAEAKFAAAGIR